MSATAVQPAFDFCAQASAGSPAAARAAPTLGERLGLVWESLLRDGTGECPLCRGAMALAGDSGRCESCGSTLT